MSDTYDPDHLRALLDAASPRPWHRGAGAHYGRDVRTEEGDGIAWCGAEPEEQAIADAALICAAVNALPALLDRVRELEGALEEALQAVHARGDDERWEALDRLAARLAREGGT